ncbi:four-carbon acid sugar kinase family protein [Pseudoruegeria sp. SK021]|uniref:four-carbon acid sugar kinase family protein n=1 Tax=Pseudoruegeria sp. SK021 TaxID=1933035 RepID=UPI000A234D47|nr:four-carbon acid sugar kinase family protein [Pseudoruegeria sp. SK021]OSP55969.1 hypothetical protein BV911_04795 [Pseudoruegeria sp. SK021]
MLMGVSADDYIKSRDNANMLVRGVTPDGGLRTAQCPEVPRTDAPSEIDAGGVSLKGRSVAGQQAIDDACAALDWLLAQGCRQIEFKYCSTFDSTRAGNFGTLVCFDKTFALMEGRP